MLISLRPRESDVSKLRILISFWGLGLFHPFLFFPCAVRLHLYQPYSAWFILPCCQLCCSLLKPASLSLSLFHFSCDSRVWPVRVPGLPFVRLASWRILTVNLVRTTSCTDDSCLKVLSKTEKKWTGPAFSLWSRLSSRALCGLYPLWPSPVNVGVLY